MNTKTRDHATTLVDWSARIETGDDVIVSVGEGAHDLAVAVAGVLGERGANLVTLYGSDEMQRSYLRNHPGDFDADPAYHRSLYEEADSVLFLNGTRNVTEMADVPDDVRQAHAQALQGVREARMDTDWVSTIHPTRALAQQADMSFEAYRRFVYDAVLRDWESLAEEMAELKTLLDTGNEVRIVKDDGVTDLSMSIANRTAVNSAASVAYDSHNLPSGEVFTAPTATDGSVLFDVPMTIQGNRIRNAVLTFEAGEVVDWEADDGEEFITATIETDDGARRLGELGIGMNRGIDRATGQILFDEKMGGTIHLALGRAYDANLPDGETGNQSAVHVDLITDMRADETRLEIDGETVQQDGRFRWEVD